VTQYQPTRAPILERGTLIAGYRIDTVIGHGGMGVVYEATQLSLKRKIALKLLAWHLSEDPRFRERFRREGELQARLDHPHIVTVHEAGESDHGLFLAMRMVRGPRLKDFILARELNAERTVRLLAPIADALDSAHEEGLIHRDVKPQNILVAARDHAFLADFGLTKLPGEKSLTDTGQFMGTLDYVAPEQIVGEPASVRTDVYAFAAVLCECLTGTVPYPRENEAAVLYAHLSEPPPRLSEREPRLPAGLDEIVTRALAKEPGDRHDTAGDLMDEVEQALGGVRLRAIRQPKPVITPPQKAVLARESEPTDEVAGAGPAKDEERTSHLRERGSRRPRVYAALAGIVALGAAVGATAGALTAKSEPTTRTVRSAAVSLTVPHGWTGRPAAIKGLRLRDSVGAASGDRGIVAGVVEHPGVSLLPRELEPRIRGGIPQGGEPVTIGGVEARRYTAMPLDRNERRLTAYTVPTSTGVVAVTCYGPGEGAIGEQCGATASALRIRRGKPFSLTPDPAYGTSVDGVIDDLQKPRRAFRQRLGKATNRYQQQEAAGLLRATFDSAARKLSSIRPAPAAAAAHADLIAALHSTGAAYRKLQEGAVNADPAQFERAHLLMKLSEGDVQGALDALKPLGYTIQ
jgi:serine/threonine protein kinase